MDFWIPQYKYQYVEWLNSHYPKNRKGEKINWNFFPLKRLKAIYIGIRKDYENAYAPSNQSVGVRQTKIQDSTISSDEARENSSRNSMGKTQEAQICFSFSS